MLLLSLSSLLPLYWRPSMTDPDASSELEDDVDEAVDASSPLPSSSLCTGLSAVLQSPNTSLLVSDRCLSTIETEAEAPPLSSSCLALCCPSFCRTNRSGIRLGLVWFKPDDNGIGCERVLSEQEDSVERGTYWIASCNGNVVGWFGDTMTVGVRKGSIGNRRRCY